MPARKPSGLNRNHDTAENKAKRAENEASLTPQRGLPIDAPSRLKEHEVASAAWRRIMRMYNELEAEIVTRLDLDLLIDYCLLTEQVQEMDRMRKVVYQLWLELGQRHDKVKTESEHTEDPDAAEALEEEAILLASKVLDAFEAVVRLDGRVDRKRSLMLQWRQSLYLTPRARAATAPTKKEREVPPDELENLLNDVSEFVNSDKGNGK
jgi:hypothetical protein